MIQKVPDHTNVLGYQNLSDKNPGQDIPDRDFLIKTHKNFIIMLTVNSKYHFKYQRSVKFKDLLCNLVSDL